MHDNVQAKQRPILTRRRLRAAAAAVAGGLLVLAPAAPAAAAAAPVRCGAVLTASTTLRADLTCTGDGLVIGADGITLNLGGHSLRGSGTGAGIRIDTPRQNITVKNGTVSGFARDGVLEGSRAVTFTNVRMLEGIGLFVQGTDVNFVHGVLSSASVDGSDSFTVTHSVIKGGQLFFVGEGGRVVLTHDTVTDVPIDLSEDSSALITDNVFTRSGIQIGITDNSLVRHNRIVGATKGVEIIDISHDNRVVDNVFEDNQIGTRVRAGQPDEVSGTVISGNTYRHNGAAGVLFETTSPGCADCPRITSNRFVDNGFSPGGLTDRLGNPVADGIHLAVAVPTPILVADNVTRHNASYGIFAPPGSVQDGGGNTSVDNPNGCLGVVCTR